MSKPRYYDVGVNLTDHMFTGMYHGRCHHKPDLHNVLLKAKRYGVEKMLVTGSSLTESINTIDIIKKYQSKDYPKMYCTVGVHPCTVMEFEHNPAHHISQLRKIITSGIESDTVHAFGEIGLDYDRLHYTPMDKQQIYFQLQLQLACEFNLPLFLHMRSACDDFIKILTPFLSGDNEGGFQLQNKRVLVHSFTGSIDELNKLLELEQFGANVFISINGAGLRENQSLEVIKHIPLSKLMIETDSPWCEIKKTHPSYKYLTKSPNAFYDINYNDVSNNEEIRDLLKPSKKSTPITLYDFLPIPMVKSDKFDKFQIQYGNKFVDSPLIKSRNEPCLIGLVAQVISGVSNIDSQTLIEACYSNSERVFG